MTDDTAGRWVLTLSGGYPDGVWCCSACMAPLTEGVITHLVGCPDTSAAIRAAERERIYAELGNDHYVIFTGDGWTVEHSVECRLSGHMSECAYHEAVRRVADEPDRDVAGRYPIARAAGRWLITGIDSAGLPEMERADG